MAQEDQEEEKKPSFQTHPSIVTNPEREVEKEPRLSSRVASWLLGDGTAQVLETWVVLVRERSSKFRPSGFPYRHRKPEIVSRGIPPNSACVHQSAGGTDSGPDGDPIKSLPCDQAPEMNLWERLGNANMLDIQSSEFSWDGLSSLHHTEHTSSSGHFEDEMNKALEVTVNSGGVVFFALFNTPENKDPLPNEAAAVIKFASSRMATQSERLGYEFAKWLGVRTPQARVVHNSNPEWQLIKDAAERARETAIAVRDEIGEITCSELLEALEMSRCLLLMNYVHGSPLLESSNAFHLRETSGKIAAALGRILMLDLVLRNEDRLPCRQLGWRGNSANLLFADKASSAKLDALEDTFNFSAGRYKPQIIRSIQKERKSYSINARLDICNTELFSQSPDASSEITQVSTKTQVIGELKDGGIQIVAIDTGVPRRPPVGKRAIDQERYPLVVELVLNNFEYSSNLLYEVSGGKLGFAAPEEASARTDSCSLSDNDMMAVVHEFRGGFRAALRDLQGFHLFLLTLNQKLDVHLRAFLSIVNRSHGESDKDDCGMSDSPSLWDSAGFGFSSPSPTSTWKERMINEAHADSSDPELQKCSPKSSPKSSPRGYRGSPDLASPASRENWSARCSRGSGEPRSLRLTVKLRDFQRFTKVDAEMSKELDLWSEMLKQEVLKLCQEKNFNTSFFEGNDSNIVVDAYELKVRLEHILERVGLISDAANTERPSLVTGSLFIGGALAARSMYTLQHLGITHIMCLCSNDIGQSDSQYPNLFEYKNFSITDNENEKISTIFEEASDFISHVEQLGGKVLVHCFEGKSRSATVVLAFLMLRKGLTLSEAWNTLKNAHRRAQPNDGFAKALLDLDRRLHGRASMDWQKKKPSMKVCPICGKNAGLSSSSLKLHLQKSHREISSGSVDSAMTMEIQKAVEALRISDRRGSVSPTPKLSRSLMH